MPSTSTKTPDCNKTTSKKRPREEENENAGAPTDSGVSEIDALFDGKKQQKKEALKQEKEQQKEKQRQKKQNFTTSSSRKDLINMKDKEWRDDGLGGKYNREGYTGRKEDGVKVYKAHLLNQKDFGNTPECPFDCNCCFI